MREIREPDPAIAVRLLTRLRQLSASDWHELAARVDSLRGERITDVWRRAERRAHWMSPVFGPNNAWQAFFALGELTGEFKSSRSWSESRAGYRANVDAMAPGAQRTHLAAVSELSELVEAACPGDRVLTEMVLLGASLVAYRAYVSSDVVRESYAFLEPVLPFAELIAQ